MDIQIRTESNQSSQSRRSPLQQFRNAALLAFAGSIIANVMILTVFGIPIALGWHFGLGWLCIAWAALGAGAVPVRSAVGLLVWIVGLVPLIPVAMYDYGYGSYGQTLASISLIAIPMYVAFWIFRLFCGRFKTVSAMATASSEKVRPKQTTLISLFGLTSTVAVLVGVAIPIAPVLFQPGTANVAVAILFLPGVLFLPLLFTGRKNSGVRAFRQLLLLCAITVPGFLLSLWFFYGDPGDGLMLALISLLVFFAAGATVIGGLTVLADWGYRVERPS